MEIGEIISDALLYPKNNLKALLIYIVLSIISGIVIAITGAGAIGAVSTSGALSGGFTVLGLVGFIVALCIYLLIEGYMLDVVKFGISREETAPEIDFARQVINGIKYLIVAFIYLIIPVIIMVLLSQLNELLGLIIGLILIILFAFGLLMAICRLAETESLGDALNIPEAIKDISKVGIVKILAIIVVFIILSYVVSAIVGIFGDGTVGGIIGAIISGICNAYLLFFYNRAIGLAYSDA